MLATFVYAVEGSVIAKESSYNGTYQVDIRSTLDYKIVFALKSKFQELEDKLNIRGESHSELLDYVRKATPKRDSLLDDLPFD